MQSIDEQFRRVRYYLRRRQFEDELDEEIQHHLAMKAAEQPNAAAARR